MRYPVCEKYVHSTSYQSRPKLLAPFQRFAWSPIASFYALGILRPPNFWNESYQICKNHIHYYDNDLHRKVEGAHVFFVHPPLELSIRLGMIAILTDIGTLLHCYVFLLAEQLSSFFSWENLFRCRIQVQVAVKLHFFHYMILHRLASGIFIFPKKNQTSTRALLSRLTHHFPRLWSMVYYWSIFNLYLPNCDLWCPLPLSQDCSLLKIECSIMNPVNPKFHHGWLFFIQRCLWIYDCAPKDTPLRLHSCSDVQCTPAD